MGGELVAGQARGGEEMSIFWTYVCPDCEFDCILRESGPTPMPIYCYLCAGDNGRLVRMKPQPMKVEDRVEGDDERPRPRYVLIPYNSYAGPAWKVWDQWLEQAEHLTSELSLAEKLCREANEALDNTLGTT
jgi:hypothetical protein